MTQSKSQKKYTLPQDKIDFIIENYEAMGTTKVAEHLNITKNVARGNYGVYLDSKKEETIFDVTKEKWLI